MGILIAVFIFSLFCVFVRGVQLFKGIRLFTIILLALHAIRDDINIHTSTRHMNLE